MEVEFGSCVALCTTEPQYEFIRDDELEEGLKRSALQARATDPNNNNVTAHRNEIATTNVVCLKFVDETKQHTSTGDPVICGSCNAVLNFKSVVTNGTNWTCEFCGKPNQLQAALDANEIPTTSVTEYLLEPPAPKQEGRAVIFCLDVSGSMSGARMKALRTSLQEQLILLHQSDPESRVGLVIFESTVTFFSGVDASREVCVGAGGKTLDNFERMMEVARECKALGKVQDTIGALRSKVNKLEANGGTALGPALLLSICIAGAVGAGSQVVICTDGQANVGLGSMRSSDSAPFYESLASTAKQQGVSVTVMSFKDTDVNLERLAVLADTTGGKVKISDLHKLGKNFGNAVADNVVAWGVQVTRVASINVKISPGDAKTDYGTCAAKSEFTAEFMVNPNAQDNTNEVDILFQTQVRHTRVSDGARMLRVFTHIIPTTRSRHNAELNAKLSLPALHAVRSSANRAQEGVYTIARLNVYAHQRLLERVANAQGKREDYLRFLDDLDIIDGELRYAERQEEKSGIRDAGDRDRDRDRERCRDRRDRRDDRGADVFYQMKAWSSRNMDRDRSRSPPRQRHRSRSRSPVRDRDVDMTERDRPRDRDDRRDRDRDDRRDRDRDDRRNDRRDRGRDDRSDPFRDRDGDRDRDGKERGRERERGRDRSLDRDRKRSR